MSVGDLVQEQRAALGQLEPAELALIRAGERPLLVAEQLGLDAASRRSPRGFTATNGWSRRGPWWWMARAISSLPVPLSPVISTVVVVRATWRDDPVDLLHLGVLADELVEVVVPLELAAQVHDLALERALARAPAAPATSSSSSSNGLVT